MLALYRHVLRAAGRFPSTKRASLVSDIKTEFREGASEMDSTKVKQRLVLAEDGLSRLQQYGGFDKRASEWGVSLSGPQQSTR